MGGAAGGAEALIVDRCAHDQEVAAGETSHPALITYTNLVDSDHMGNLSSPTPGHWRYPSNELALLNQNLQLQTPYILRSFALPCAAVALLWATLCALR